MIEEIILTGRRSDRSAVARTFPSVVGVNDGVGRIFRPGSEQLISADHALRITAFNPATCIAGIEEVEASAVTENVRALDYATLPAIAIISNELRRCASQV